MIHSSVFEIFSMQIEMGAGANTSFSHVMMYGMTFGEKEMKDKP